MAWTPAQAETYLREHELFGMRFGLERIRRLDTALGTPSRSFRAIQVVGTNGKSSTARMIAALLERHGLRTGAYTSPHLVSYVERIEIGEQPLPAQAFARAIEHAATATERVNRTLPEGEAVTQFELLTAAALWALADAGVEVAVVEAGLGARYDATSVVDADVQVLTNVGLEHTRYLGPTVEHIAAEKLALVKPGARLVLGADLPASVRRLAAATGATVTTAAADVPGVELRARGGFQRRNFALACAAAATFLEGVGDVCSTGQHKRRPPLLDPDAVRAAAASVEVAGRFQLVDEHPPTLLDGAHNPDSIAALAAELPALLAGRPLTAVLSILDDKDAAAMLARLQPLTRRLYVTRCDSPRALPQATLESLARQLGFAAVIAEPAPQRAYELARAAARGEDGVVLVTGSIYLLGELLAGQEPALAGRTSHPRGSTG